MSVPRPRHRALVPAGLGISWLALGLVVLPALLEAAYAGRSLPFLNALLAPHTHLPLAFFQEQVRLMTVIGALAGLAFAGFAYALRSPAASRRLVPDARPGTLGALRMLVCAVLLTSTLWEDLPSTAALPRALVQPMGVLQLFYALPGFEALAGSAAGLGVLQAATAVLLVLGLVGWRTRLVLPLAALGYLLVGGLLRQYAWFYHTGLLALYLLVVLSFVPAGDGWSVDRLLRLWRGQPVPPAGVATRRYGWSVYALWVALALPYTAAGLSKLRNGGLYWWDAVSFKHYLLACSLRPMQFDFDVSLLLIPAPDLLFEALALSALLGEVLFALVLFSRLARRVLPLVMAGMHVGILFLQNILFFDLIVLQLVFLDLTPVRKAVARRLAAGGGALTVPYDAGSAYHRSVVRVLGALDLFERLTFVPVSSGEGGACLTAVHGGRSVAGAALYRRLARALPALWPLVPFLALPGLPALLDRAVARVRARSGGAAAPEGEREAGFTPYATGSPRLALALAGILVLCWVFRIEFYPLTGMQMFSKREAGVVTYEVAYAHLRSGAVIRAPIEASIGAMADSRYRRLLQAAFDEKRTPLSDAFLRACMARWNRTAAPADRITRIEVQRWQWDFVADRDNPRYGHLVARKVVPSFALAKE